MLGVIEAGAKVAASVTRNHRIGVIGTEGTIGSGIHAEYLKKLTRYTQFITITHRRGTMLAADRLYGITMQEKGVSALVSVSLIEDKLS